MLKLLRIKGYCIRSLTKRAIDRDTIVVPEIWLDTFECDLPRVMRPIFDAVWNAAGYPRSLNYDSEGNWQARQGN